MNRTFLLCLRVLLLSFLVVIIYLSGQNSYGQTATWTIMVYLDADNNLEEAGIDDFNEMEVVGSTDSVNIVVQFDRVEEYTNSNGDWTDTRRFKVLQDADVNTITSPAVEIMGEMNMGDPETLSDFITWAASEYPAEHYALVLWNHGGGWYKSQKPKQKLPLPDKDVCYDDTDDDYLTNYEVSTALNESAIHFDILAYDACVMGMIEVAYQIRNLANIMIASEEGVPMDGFDYTAFLSALVADQDMSAEMLSTHIVNTYGDFYVDYVTLSAVDLTKVKGVAQQLDSLTNNIMDDDSVWDTVGSVWMESFRIGWDYVDLGDFTFRLSEAIQNPIIQQASAVLLDSFQNHVIANYAAPELADASGLTIYFPEAEYYWPEYEEEGAGRDFADSTNWVDFLHAFHSNYFPDFTEPNNHFANATILEPYMANMGKFQSKSDIDIYRVYYTGDYIDDAYIELVPPIDADMYLYTVIDTIIEKIDSSKNAGIEPERIYFNERDSGYYYIVLKPLEASDELYSLSGIGYFYDFDWLYGSAYTMAFDDGEPEEQYYSTDADEGVGMIFNGYGQLDGVWYYITDLEAEDGGSPNLTLQLHLYEYGEDVWGYAPETVYADRVGWNYIDISDQEIFLFMEPTIIGFTWDGISTPAVGVDSVCSDESAYQFVSGYWSPVEDSVLYFIRPVFSIPVEVPQPCHCNGLTVLTEPTGSFEDGSGDDFYSNDCYCTWLIQPERATSITLTIEELDLESNYDFLYVYNGDNTDNLIGEYDGYVNNVSLASTGGSMFIEFVSDYSVTYPGWQCSYSSVIAPDGIDHKISELSDWQIYPNPGTGIINFSADMESTLKTSVNIYNSMAQLIDEYTIEPGVNNYQIDISDNPKGIYYIKLYNETSSLIRKYVLK